MNENETEGEASATKVENRVEHATKVEMGVVWPGSSGASKNRKKKATYVETLSDERMNWTDSSTITRRRCSLKYDTDDARKGTNYAKG